MSVQAMASVFARSRMGGPTRLVLLAVANYGGDRGAWPSVDTLARDCRMSRRSVQEALRRAETAGEIHTEPNAGERGTNRYWLHIEEGGCRFCTRAKSRRKVAPEPLGTNPPISTNVEIPPQAFVAFWAVFPRRVGKRTALKAWRQACLRAAASAILAGAARYRDDPNREAAFTKHPSTWLDSDGWEDDPLPARDAAMADRDETRERKLAEAHRLAAESRAAG